MQSLMVQGMFRCVRAWQDGCISSSGYSYINDIQRKRNTRALNILKYMDGSQLIEIAG